VNEITHTVSFRISVNGALKAVSSDLVISSFLIATGFVSAGVLASAYQLVTAQPVRFDLGDDRLLMGLATVVLLMFAGPAVLMRNAVRGRMIERRHGGWLVASTAIAGAWSLCSGTVVMQFALALGNSL